MEVGQIEIVGLVAGPEAPEGESAFSCPAVLTHFRRGIVFLGRRR